MINAPNTVGEQETTFQQRVLTLIGDETQASFARRAGISQSGLNRILQGGDAGRESLIAIAKAGGRSVEWLATGQDAVASSTPDEVELIRHIDLRPSAGSGRSVQSQDTEHVKFPRMILQRLGLSPDKARVAYALGTSMEPTIADGSMLIIDITQKQPVDGKIYIFSIGDDIFIKRLRKRPGVGWLIHSDNPIYAEVPFPKEEHVRFYGRVSWTEQRL